MIEKDEYIIEILKLLEKVFNENRTQRFIIYEPNLKAYNIKQLILMEEFKKNRKRIPFDKNNNIDIDFKTKPLGLKLEFIVNNGDFNSVYLNNIPICYPKTNKDVLNLIYKLNKSLAEQFKDYLEEMIVMSL